MEINGKVALVTGANRGIGAAIVEALLAAGASRVYAAARTPTSVGGDARVVPIALDVTDRDQVQHVASLAGDVQILVNNAGVAFAQPLIAAANTQSAEREMSVNYFGTLNTVRAFAPVLARNGGGAIVNVLSILSRVSNPQLGSYAASKAAALSLTQAIRAELAAQHTLVIGLMPGFVDTDMAKGLTLTKLAPSDVARALIDAVGARTEDVYPGEAAVVAEQLRHDPKGVERAFAGLLSR